MFKKNLLALAAIMAVSAQSAFSMPAKPGLLNAVQPDGTIVKIYLQGDGLSNTAYSSDGYLLTCDDEGFYVFADCNDEGVPVATDIRNINPETRSDEIRERIATFNQNMVKQSPAISEQGRLKGKRNGPGLQDVSFPSKGEIRSVVILVEFANNEFTIENPNEYYSRMLNEEGFNDYNATGSVRDYFLESSNGQFSPSFDVYGPVKMKKIYAYYGQNNPWGGETNAAEMVVEACQGIDDDVDFSIYDYNNDGYIDNVYIFYAGYGEADGGGANTIWPHSYNVTSALYANYEFDGVILNHYACSNELQFYNLDLPDGIGPFCHEFSHVLGLPDIYSSSYTMAFIPGTWEILAEGGYNNDSRTPPYYSSYERYALDWLEPEILEEGTHELLPLSDSNTAYLMVTENENEYFLFENRQQQGFDSFIPGHGMLVWHIDYDYDLWSINQVNDDPDHQRIDIVEADNILTEETRAGDSFPGEANVTQFTPQTIPAFVSWANNPMPFGLYDISESEDGIITFTVGDGITTRVNGLKSKANIFTVKGNIVSCPDGNAVIYDSKGYQVAALNSNSITLPEGLYIIVKDNEAMKFVIK